VYRLWARNNQEYTGKWIDATQKPSPEMKKATELLQTLRDFYAARGYKYLGTQDGFSFAWTSENANVSYSWLNMYMNVVDKDLETVPTGPILMTGVKETVAPSQLAAHQDLLKPALDKIGMTMDDYARYREALYFAYGDSLNEGAIQPQVPPELPSNTPAAELGKIRTAYEKINFPLELRRSNVEAYKRHIADLEPVMKVLSQRQ
jgi:hypothetical protein